MSKEDGIKKVATETLRAWDREHGMREPDWEPLVSLFGPCRVEETGRHSPVCGFMFMGYAAGPEGSGGIRLYKHGITRRYINLDAHGQTYRFICPDDPKAQGWYEPIPMAEALRHVFEGIERLGASIDTPYDEAYKCRRDTALRDAGYKVISAGPDDLGGEA